MEGDKFQGYGTDKESLLIYIDDNSEQVSAYVRNIIIKDGLITFQTNKNIITIPISRIIKIKEKVE